MTIDGDLTVNAPNATVNNNATITGNIIINAVSSNTWNELVSGNSLLFKAEGKTLNIGSHVTVKSLTLDATDAKITIENTANFTNPVVIKEPVTIVSENPVQAVIDNGIEVIVKVNEADEGKPIIGTGGETELDPTEPEQPSNRANVENKKDLEDALANENIIEIYFENDIDAGEIKVNRAVTIDGKGNTLTGNIVVNANNVKIQDLIVDVEEGVFGIQFYKVTGGELEEVKVMNSTKGGIYVNGSKVTVTNVALENNTWGGIEVSQGNNVTAIPKLVVNSITHDSEETPAIWIDEKTTNNGWVDAADYHELQKLDKNQLWFVEELPVVDGDAPVVSVVYPNNLAYGAEELKLIFEVEDESDLAFLEIDHNLEGTLPEFKLYPISNPWGSYQASQLAETYGVTADYDSETKTWTLTFEAGAALEAIKDKDVFRVYFVVEDVYGNTFGTMYGTTPKNTINIQIGE